MNQLYRGLAFIVLFARAAYADEATLTWHGQSCFVLQSAQGARVLIDPIPGTIGYPLPAPIKADIITISHEHKDHNNTALAEGKPKILRGLADPKTWAKIDETVKDVHIRNVGVWHDEKQGAERGLNSVFIFETGGLKIAHLGDLGHLLTPEQQKAIGPVDILLIPVGGVYTIDATMAWKVIDEIKPKSVIVPMHYKTEALQIPLATLEGFLKGQKNVRRVGTNVTKLAKPAKTPEIVVLSWK